MIKTKYNDNTNTVSIVIEKDFDIARVYYDIFIIPINYIGAFYGNSIDILQIIDVIKDTTHNSYDAPGNICRIYLNILKFNSDAYKSYSFVVFNNIIKWFRERCERVMNEINIPNGEIYYFEENGVESYFTANFSKGTIEENPDKLSMLSNMH